MRQPLCCSDASAGMRGERLWWWRHILYMTQQHHLASMAAQISSMGISHLNLLPHIPSINLSTVNSSPHPGIAPQPLNSSSQPSRGLASLSRVHMDRAKTVWFLLHLHCHRSVVSLSALNVSHLIDNCPDVEIRPLLQFPLLLRAGPVLLKLLFFPVIPLSYWVLRDSIYSFPLVRCSCPLSAGALNALLCLKVYSWCNCGERCTSCPPTPPSSCSPYAVFVRYYLLFIFKVKLEWKLVIITWIHKP